MSSSPALVVSIDFELRWGVWDVLGRDWSRYLANLEGVREVVPSLLELFVENGVRASWATVAALGCESWDEYRATAPVVPQYRDRRLVPDIDEFERRDPRGRLHFAPDLVAAIAEDTNQELASHTFSHIYFREDGCTLDDVERDALSVRAFFEARYRKSPRSLVFPRNQVAYTERLRRYGIENVRDNPRAWYWEETSSSPRPAARLARLADAFVPLGARTQRRDSQVQRAAHFIRFNLPDSAWRLHASRIATDAARMRCGELIHLWFHPHNLGANPARSLQRLRALVERIREHQPELQCLTMAEVASTA